MELVEVKGSDFGLEESKASQISQVFKPMLDTMVDLEEEANEIFKLDPESENAAMKAKELRLRYVKVRTGTAKIHKEQKAFYLAGGKFIDGWKNAQLFASQGVEEKLMSIEKHAENKAKEWIEAIAKERKEELIKYTEVVPADIGEMEDDIWEGYLEGMKIIHDKKVAADKKEADEKAAKEKADKIAADKLVADNKKLKAENAVKDKAIEDARIAAEEKETARVAKEAKDKKVKEAAEKAIQDVADKAAAEKLAIRQAELNKGDAAKVRDLIADLESLKDKYVFKSAKNKKTYGNVGKLIDKVVGYINEK